MKVSKITLSNDYHNTSVTLRVRNNTLSPAQIRYARGVLCGISDCTCGNALGMRGPQEWDVEYNWDDTATVKHNKNKN